MSTFDHLSFPNNKSGSYTFMRKMSGFTVWIGHPLTLTFPLPVRTKATATEVFLRPKHCTRSFLASAILPNWDAEPRSQPNRYGLSESFRIIQKNVVSWISKDACKCGWHHQEIPCLCMLGLDASSYLLHAVPLILFASDGSSF